MAKRHVLTWLVKPSVILWISKFLTVMRAGSRKPFSIVYAWKNCLGEFKLYATEDMMFGGFQYFFWRVTDACDFVQMQAGVLSSNHLQTNVQELWRRFAFEYSLLLLFFASRSC